ncbi:hypothetical protein FF36_05480 [Frankia torreyi]|uniref:Uncharacterized protein n=1 Tax=Frankia torreyi TaxID=1856 RepID=A0A0D8B7G0_9ACTN|nr:MULTISPECIES: hypothetical protein [Frankia]KJE20203.1 hypothetical protein FF36_05480 [Frankia torreyi]KQM02508.1 hypothetical protein FF86_10645 [Frankia sp. CpI1-P]
MSAPAHVVLDQTAMLALGGGNVAASRLVARADRGDDLYLYAPACALVEADRARRGVAEHIASLAAVIVLDLDLPAALAVAREENWATAHTRYAATPTPERIDGAAVATATPEHWQDQPFDLINLAQ